MTSTHKKQAFEYLVFKLVKWYKSNHNSNINDLSILKVLKLTFFVSAVGTTRDTKDTLLDNVFDNYFAMPYGHVESDIYTSIRTGSLTNVTINNRNSIIHSDIELPSEKLKKDIDNAVGALKASNPNIILASSFDLVDLSHSWYSWQYYYGLAKRQRVNSIPIPVSDIKEEEKIFML